jgi:hypothetical protein
VSEEDLRRGVGSEFDGVLVSGAWSGWPIARRSQISALESTERVRPVADGAHRRAHISDLPVAEHHPVLVLATGTNT